MFLQNREKLITMSTAINPRLTAQEHIEGADITADAWIPKQQGSASRADLFLYPFDEIKVVNEFLQKDWKYNNGETSGTLPFEIFHKWKKYPNEHFPYAGFTVALYNAEELTRIKHEWNVYTNWYYDISEKVVRPGTLVFFLYHGIPLQEQPFACVAFEDIEALKRRLTDCLPFEWNLTHWNLPALSNQEYWNQFIKLEDYGYFRTWDPERGGMVQNCWHVPLRTLADIATVTLIGAEDPVIKHNWRKLETLERTRYEYVARQANGRRILI